MYHVTKRQTSKLIACKLVSSTGTPSSTATCSCGQLGSAKPAPARSRQYSSTAVLQRFRGGTSLADQLAAPQRQKQDDAPESAAESTEKPAYGAAKQDSNSSSGIHQLLDSALADRERAVERNRARKLAQKSVRRTKHATKKHKDESVMAGEEAEKRGGGNGRDAKHREDSASAGELAQLQYARRVNRRKPPIRQRKPKGSAVIPPNASLSLEERLHHDTRRLDDLRTASIHDGPWEELSDIIRRDLVTRVETSRRDKRNLGQTVDESMLAEELARARFEKGVKERPHHIALLEERIARTTQNIKDRDALKMLKAVRDKKPQNAVAGTSRPPTTNPRLARLNNDIDVRPARSAPIKEEFTVGTDSEAIAKALPLALKRANGKSEVEATPRTTYRERRRAAPRASVDRRGPETKADDKPLSAWSRVVSPSSTPFVQLPRDDVPVASLSHGLHRVLFNPGVHFVRDPRSRVYNFPRTLENVPPIEDFELNKLPRYTTSSKDARLMELAEKEDKTFVGSTSSTVAMLCQIYFWMSKGKELNLDVLSAPWRDEDASFSMGQRLPASVTLHHRDGRYAIDADKSMDAAIDHNILADYGHMMEKLLTTSHEEFLRFLSTSNDPAPTEIDEPQAYQYSTTERMVLRSQLDAHDPRLPRVTFDVKTRGSVAIRQDRLNHEESAGYTVDRLQGPWESFEREYYDLIRSAFLKYQFQARIGGMDGCFVAFHSTQRFFGFQYVPIEEMDVPLFGTTETGDQVFRLALKLLEDILIESTTCYPGESIRITFAAGKHPQEPLRVFVHPAETQEGESTEGAPGMRMTLLELHGANYLDRKPAPDGVEIQPADQEDSTEHNDALAAAATMPDTVVITDPVSSEAKVKTWEIGYDITRSSTHAATDQPQPITPSQILSRFRQTRDVQTMFSVLTLPTGISRKEVMAAAERIAQLDDAGVDELDPSDLAVKFPVKEGMDYKVRPSRALRDLRILAREGGKRLKEQEKEDEHGEYIELESVLKVKRD